MKKLKELSLEQMEKVNGGHSLKRCMRLRSRKARHPSSGRSRRFKINCSKYPGLVG